MFIIAKIVEMTQTKLNNVALYLFNSITIVTIYIVLYNIIKLCIK